MYFFVNFTPNILKEMFMNMYDNPKMVAHSFDEKCLSPYLKQAQWSEFVALKEVIHELAHGLG